jgi:hypothetical protein
VKIEKIYLRLQRVESTVDYIEEIVENIDWKIN